MCSCHTSSSTATRPTRSSTGRLIRPSWPARAAEQGHGALALTDHDGLHGAMEMAHALKPLGVRPITGAEVTLDDGTHLTLLCETREGYTNLCRLLTASHWHTRRWAREGWVEAGRRQDPLDGEPHISLDDVEPLAAGLVCLSGCARDGAVASRVEAGRHAEAAAVARRLLRIFGPEQLPDRAPAPLLAPRPPPQQAARRAGRAARRPSAGHRQRARTRARPDQAPGRDGGGPARKDARRDRAEPARQLLARARRARADGGALPRAPGRGGGERAPRGAPALRPHRGPRLPLPRVGGPGGGLEARRPLPRPLRGALRQELRGRRPARRGAARDPPPRAVRLLPAPPRHARARPRGGRGGARAGVGAPPAAAGARTRVERVVGRLLPHRALARGPDRQRAAPRALPERGADRAAGHRPRLPARHPRRADPPRARPLRPRPLRARGGLLDLPGALGGA